MRTKQVLSVYQRWAAWCMVRTSYTTLKHKWYPPETFRSRFTSVEVLVAHTCVRWGCPAGHSEQKYLLNIGEKIESRQLFEVMFHFHQHCSSFAHFQAPGQSDFSGWLHSPPTFTPLALKVLCRYRLIPHTKAPGALEGLLSSWRRYNVNVTKDIQEGALFNWLPLYVLYKWLQCYQAFPLAA